MLWLAIPLGIVIIFFLLYYKQPYYLVDPSKGNEEQKLHLNLSSDKTDHDGNTEFKAIHNTAGKLIVEYQLRKGHQFLYATVGFKNDSTFDFSGYDDWCLKVKASKGRRLQIGLYNLERVQQKQKDTLEEVLHQAIVNVSDTFTEIKFPLRQLYIPEWWFMVKDSQAKDYQTPDFKKSPTLFIGNCINLQPNIIDRIEIEEWSFRTNPFILLKKALLFVGVYYVLLSGWLFLRKKNKKKALRFQPQQGFVEAFQSEEEATLFQYLTARYMQELSLADVQQQTGIAEKRISGLIKEKTGLNFKQFLTQLRLAEAKRLLKKSDLQISEIAFKVGFGNVSHFNRVFKSEQGCSPNEYRKDKQNLPEKQDN